MSFEMHYMSTYSLFFGKHRCSSWHGAGMGPIDNFSVVTGSRRNQATVFRYTRNLL